MSTLFLLAHPDDEAYGPGGTIASAAKTDDVIVAVACAGVRPGAAHTSLARQQTLLDNCSAMGVTDAVIYQNNDLYLDYHSALKIAVDMIAKHQPTVVYTHSAHDVHKDHRILAEAALAACRPTPSCPVQALLSFEIPGSTDWGFDQTPSNFTPNIFVDVSQYMPLKERMLSAYTTETYPFPDARSVESMVVTAQFRGRTVGMAYAEAFQLVYARVRIDQ
jgi:N-acetylglucosamine malate deacetylase 1